MAKKLTFFVPLFKTMCPCGKNFKWSEDIVFCQCPNCLVGVWQLRLIIKTQWSSAKLNIHQLKALEKLKGQSISMEILGDKPRLFIFYKTHERLGNKTYSGDHN